MKHIKLFLAAILVCLSFTAVAQKDYNPQFNYRGASNLFLGGSVSYQRSVFTNNAQNFGAEIRLSKRVSQNWYVRSLLEVNGFLNNGFDRDAKALVGVSFNALNPFYLFVDYGGNFNPSASQKFGLAADGGFGLLFDIGNNAYMHLEAGLDGANNGDVWRSNAFAKVGYSWYLGVVEKDRIEESVISNQPEIIKELRQDNAQLRQTVKASETTIQDLQKDISNASLALQKFEERLAKCSEALEMSNSRNVELPVVYFEKSSSDLNALAKASVYKIAEAIQKNPDSYFVLEGYSSNSGNEDANYQLSVDRAYAVYYELLSLGIPDMYLTPVGKGQTDSNTPFDQRVIVTKY